MYNLPADSNISGNLVYHEGNHGRLGNPHEQYLNAMVPYHTVNTKSDKGKWYKIAEIKYIPNSNVTFKYRISLFAINEKCNNFIDINAFNDIQSTVVTMNTDNNIRCGVKLSKSKDDNDNPLNNIEVYIQINRVWWTVCYRLDVADNTRYYHYNDGYAFNRITFFNETIGVNDLISDVEIAYRYEPEYFFKETEMVSISSNSTSYLNLDFPGLIAKDSFIQISPIGSFPAELSYHWFLPNDNQIRIVIRNHASYTKELPKMKWNFKITRLR